MIYTDTDSGMRRMEITSKQLDHHEIAAGLFDKFGMGQTIKQIANLKDLQIKMIKLFGAEYEKYYF